MQDTGPAVTADTDAARHPLLQAPADGYVFIVTYGRSGSTLLQNVLNEIDGYCIRGENGNLAYHLCKCVEIVSDQHNFTMRRLALNNPSVDRHALICDVLGSPVDPWYRAELVDPDHVAKSLCPTPSSRTG